MSTFRVTAWSVERKEVIIDIDAENEEEAREGAYAAFVDSPDVTFTGEADRDLEVTHVIIARCPGCDSDANWDGKNCYTLSCPNFAGEYPDPRYDDEIELGFSNDLYDNERYEGGY